MNDFISFLKDNPIFMVASAAVLLLVILLIILIVKLTKDTKKEKNIVKGGYRVNTNPNLHPNINNHQNGPKQAQNGPVNNLYVDNSYKTESVAGNPVVNSFVSSNEGAQGNIVQIPVLNKDVKSEIAQNVKSGAYETQALFTNPSKPNTAETELLIIPKQKPLALLSYKVEDEEKKFEIYNAVTNIGRDSEQCDFVVEVDTHIGRKHAMLYLKGTKFYIMDLNSKNGTFINGEKIQGEKELFNGDTIKLAATDFEFTEI